MTSTQESKQSDLFSRLRSFSRELYSLDKTPLIDTSFSFPWDALGNELKNLFGCDLSIQPGNREWKKKEDLYKGIPEPTIPLGIALPGVEGQLLLVLSRGDIELFMGHVLHTDVQALLKEDPSFFDQFLAFFSAELLACAREIGTLKQLSPRLTTPPSIEAPGCLCQDFGIFFQGNSSHARLIMPPEFLDAWREFRCGKEPLTPHADLSQIEVNLCVEGGRTFLTPAEIAALHTGDVLLVDHPFYIPGSPKSRVFLTHQGQPLFRGKLEDGGIKILEMPLQHEAFLPLGGFSMATKEPAPQEDPVPPPTEETSGAEQDPPAKEETFEWEEEEKGEEPAPLTAAEAKSTVGVSTALSKEPINIQQLPLTVIVELAELSMSVDKLASLQPGNLLDLDMRPESGVMLVVNGKVFGQGELVLIGDNVGVRIKEIGFAQPAH